MPQKLEIAPNTVLISGPSLAVLRTRQKRKKDILNAVVLAELFLMFPGTHSLAGKSKSCKKCGYARSALTKLEANTKNSKEKYEGKTINGFL